ncbi:hypothetical protein MVEN_00618100 [Mycena venus]|uniref:Uncharacterized protein n=1 Tax=Mycena venus TaxID=2733690 RepID=A0A8H6YK45_9AGAR|nr:hypothetical protein MVEN_00618100 [Mycena venus]
MKDLATSTIPRSANLSRFRPISLPVYLDSKASPKRQPRPPVESPLASPVVRHTGTKTNSPSGGFQISAIPRILRPAARPPLLSKRPTTPSVSVPSSPAAIHPQANESRCCQMLIHGLFVAFEDDFTSSGVPRSEELRADGGRPFTHFISLSTRHSAPIAHTSDRRTGARRLKLRLPRLYSPESPTTAELEDKVARARDAAAAQGLILSQDDYYDIVFDEGEGTRYTSLEALQLLAARDFLYASGLSKDSEHVRVLVTTPRDHRTDAIAVVMGYLALALGYPVARVLRTQDNHPRVLAIWKDTISEECAQFLEDVCHL